MIDKLFKFSKLSFTDEEVLLIYLLFRREKRSVPFIVTRCVREVERRGMQEVGVYRVSGLASDITKLKKSFESSK